MATQETTTFDQSVTNAAGWLWLYECRSQLAVLRRSLDLDDDGEAQIIHSVSAIERRLGEAMDDLDKREGEIARKAAPLVRRDADDSNVSDILEDLRNRIRWASGTADCISGNPNMDGFVIDSCSSIEQHLREAWELVDELSLFGASLRKGGAS